MTDQPIVMVAKMVKWAKHGEKGKRRGPATSNSHSKHKTYQKLLAEQAIGYGWLNGRRIRRAGH
ncbi:MAG TPA: hypothetical protein VIY48_17825 [Candidatus Paceibacterota bacterium]